MQKNNISIVKIFDIIPSSKQTKTWRQNQKWYCGGKSNECEKYQFNLFTQITGFTRNENNDRLNYETLELKSVSEPNNDDGFNWSEDFDSTNFCDGEKFYINMKFVCDQGGAQTRTLREVYHFTPLHI